MASQIEIAVALGLTKGRVSQLVKEGMPTESVEAARAWREARKQHNEREGHISQPVQPLRLGDLDSILQSVTGETGNTEMDERIRNQVELCRLTREVFLQALNSGDPAQGKLYGNYDRAIGTLLSLEKVRFQREQEEGRLIDADAAAARFSKVLGQLRSVIERAELTVAPAANPDNPPKALKAFREFKDDLFRKISEYSPEVRDGSPQIGDDVAIEPPTPANAEHFDRVGGIGELSDESLDEIEGEEEE